MNKLYFNCLFLMIFCVQGLIAQEQAEIYTFFNLEALSPQEEAKPEEDAKKIRNGQLIEIRGFLYETSDSTIILAAEPNLKSCCVGSTAKRQKQLLVYGDVKKAIGQPAAVTLKGNLKVDFEASFPFLLDDAVIQEEKPLPYAMMVLAGFFLIFICALFSRLGSGRRLAI